jgi:MerR family transcriptional regulator, thiopeptide resistance regulator
MRAPTLRDAQQTPSISRSPRLDLDAASTSTVEVMSTRTRSTATDESWSIVEVARIAGVTSRTLRHYDDVGLVAPAYVGGNGYRYYGRAQLHRLQEVLVLRELGLPLDAIGRVLDGTGDRVEILRRHQQALQGERDRLERLVRAVGRAIDEREGGTPVDPAELFDGFDAEKQRQYESELVDRYGPGVQAHIDESWRRVGRTSKAEAERIQADLAQRDREYAALLDAGVAPDDPRTQAVTAEHHRWVSQFWTPGAEEFAGLGDLYVDHPGFKARYDAVRPGLAEYVRDAMAAYAIATLA